MHGLEGLKINELFSFLQCNTYMGVSRPSLLIESTNSMIYWYTAKTKGLVYPNLSELRYMILEILCFDHTTYLKPISETRKCMKLLGLPIIIAHGDVKVNYVKWLQLVISGNYQKHCKYLTWLSIYV